MLLLELINMLGVNLEVNVDRLIELLKAKDIRLDQRLLMERDKKPEDKTKRGRGRPKKNSILLNDDSETLEVEILKIDGKTYYKTQEDVVLNEELEIQGILINNKIEISEK